MVSEYRLEECEGTLVCNVYGETTRVSFEPSDTWDEVTCGLCRAEYAVYLRVEDTW